MSGDFPHAVYFDTNSIRQLSYGISNVEYLKLKELCRANKINLAVPEVVVYEWYYMQQREIKSEISKIRESLRKTNLLLNITQPEYKEPKKMYSTLISKVSQYIREAGMRWVKTTRKISIRKLIVLAAKKIKPFEEKGEKGFRDMIMLLTIVEDMKKNNFHKAILVSDDAVFKHKEIKNHLSGKDLIIVDNFSSCLDYLDKLSKKKAMEYFSDLSDKILNYLQTKKDEIFKYVIENAQVSSDFLKGEIPFLKEEDKVFGNINRVISVRPTEISSAFPSLTGKSEPVVENMQNITFTVKVDFQLEVSPYNFFNKPKFSIGSPSEYEKTRDAYPAMYLDPVEQTISRSINVEAVVEEKDGNYRGLSIKRVITF